MEGNNIKSTNLQTINLGLPKLKESEAKWMVEMGQYFADNPQIRAGIAGTLDGHMDIQDEPENDNRWY